MRTFSEDDVMLNKLRRVRAGTESKTQHKHRLPKRSIGVAIITAFLFVPALFVLLYILSGQPPDAGLPANAAGVEPNEMHTHERDDITIPAEALQMDIPPGDPEIDIIGVAYLTFDDGPSHTVTSGILDILKDEEIKATFFVLPREGADDLFRRIIDEGHEMGNHTYSHDYDALFRGSVGAFREDVVKAQNFVESNFGYTTTSFRFPAGTMTWSRDIRNPRIEVINNLGYKYYDWHIDSGDAHALQTDKAAETIASNVLEETRGREHVIILLHDYSTRATTLEALPMIIDGLRRQGYEFDIISNYP